MGRGGNLGGVLLLCSQPVQRTRPEVRVQSISEGVAFETVSRHGTVSTGGVPKGSRKDLRIRLTLKGPVETPIL
jgi:hypothetical protein